MFIKIIKDTKRFFSVISVAFFVFFSANSVFSENDTAYIPFIVNVNAKVIAWHGYDTVSIDVEAETSDTLAIYLGSLTSISAKHDAVRMQGSAPVLLSDSRGNVTLRLPQTSYQNARVSLYSVNGKRIISHKVDASASAKRISTPNAASGIYILSVKGISGGSFSGRLSHKGGKLNIGVSFGAGEAVFPLMKDAYAVAQNDNEDAWTIRVTAVGYTDSTYQFTPEIGMNSVHNITLRRELETMGSFTDSRDGKTYGWVLMPDGKRWMAQNLNYDTLDGTGSWCYENSADSCVKYGRLYNWAAAMDIDASFNNTPWNGSDENHQGICPVGWRLPSHADWNALMAAVGGEETAGTKLKSQTGWYDGDSDYIPGTDDYGFSALPGGRRWNGGSFGGAGYLGHWWSASEDNSGRAYGRDMNYGIQDVFSYWLYKSFGFSVRCLRD